MNNNILDYILQRSPGSNPTRQGIKILLNPCPICGHKDHFFVYPENNSYYSFSGCCKGGSIVDALIEFEGIPLAEAMRRVHGEGSQSGYADDICRRQKEKQKTEKLAGLLTQKVESFFNAITQKYKLFKLAELECYRNGIDRMDPFYRWIRHGVAFYDRLTDEFINGSFEERVRLMQSAGKEYFFKLNPEVVTNA